MRCSIPLTKAGARRCDLITEDAWDRADRAVMVGMIIQLETSAVRYPTHDLFPLEELV